MTSEKAMRAVLRLKPGERARSEEHACHREYYQNSMVEMRHAAEWWKASTVAERSRYTRTQPLEWDFLTALEQMLVTVALLNSGQVAADLEYEAEQRARGFKGFDRD